IALPFPGLRKFISDIRYGSPSICTYSPLRKSPVLYVATALPLLRLVDVEGYSCLMEILALSSESVRGDSSVEDALRAATDEGGRQSLPATDGAWHDQLRLAIRDPAELIAVVQLPTSLLEPALRAARSFPLFAPWPYIARMVKGDPNDPLLRQVLPLAEEMDRPPGFTADPVGDATALL